MRKGSKHTPETIAKITEKSKKFRQDERERAAEIEKKLLRLSQLEQQIQETK